MKPNKIDWSEFRNLNPRAPWRWPQAPRRALRGAAGLVGVFLSINMLVSPAFDELNDLQAKELALRDDYSARAGKALALQVLGRHKVTMLAAVEEIEKQLPGRADMDALYSGINEAGLRSGLKFVTFSPSPEKVSRYYAELPITVKLSGDFDSMGRFTADVAALPRIVTLHDIVIKLADGTLPPLGEMTSVSPLGHTRLEMTLTAKTYRYLDATEAAEQRQLEIKARKAAEEAERARKKAAAAAANPTPAKEEKA